jgi:hypothetical protein
MDYREFPFWDDTYVLCKEIAETARRGAHHRTSPRRILAEAAGEVLVLLAIAARTDDDTELRSTLLRACGDLQTVESMLTVLTIRGEIDLATACDFLRRGANVQCDMLTFYQGRS